MYELFYSLVSVMFSCFNEEGGMMNAEAPKDGALQLQSRSIYSCNTEGIISVTHS